MTVESKLFNQSVEKAFAVLRAFGHERRAMTLPEIAVAADISKSSAQRFAFTLETMGYLRRETGTRRYVMTPRVLELGFHYLHSDPLHDRANPYLLELNIRSKETVNLWRPDGVDLICIARFPGHMQVTSHMPLGKRFPMYCSASGRAYLSRRSGAEVRDILLGTEFVKYTANTPTGIDDIERRVDDGRANGFTWAFDEYYRGDIAIAAPIVGPLGEAIGAINLSVPITRWAVEEAVTHFAPHVMETARAISGASEPAVVPTVS